MQVQKVRNTRVSSDSVETVTTKTVVRVEMTESETDFLIFSLSQTVNQKSKNKSFLSPSELRIFEVEKSLLEQLVDCG